MTISMRRKLQKVFKKVIKHCRKRRNCSLTSNFSLSHSVFKRLVLQTRKPRACLGKGSTFTKESLVVMTLKKKPFEKMENMLVTSIFSFSQNVFYPFQSKFQFFTLTLSQTSPGFYVSAVEVLQKHCGKRRNCS